MPPPQPPEKNTPSGFLGMPWFWMAITGLACAVTLPIRYGEGIAGVSRSGFCAVLVIVLYALFAPCPLLMTYLMIFIGFAVIKRATKLFRHHLGAREMSGFEGYPLACLLGIPCGFARQVIEPAMVYAFGWYLRQANPPLGCFFLAGAIAGFLKTLFETIVQANRDTTAGDLRIQMEIDARRRARRGW